MTSDSQIKDNMDRMYRWTRHIYDASRKYYLLGRDRLVQNLDAKEGDLVCEMGCGTARNLAKMAKAYPNTKFFGMDASDEMLRTAKRNLQRRGAPPFPLAQGYAQNFDPVEAFGLEKPLDKIIFSYALSIIPPWRESVDHALTLIEPGSEIHIVDFGGQEGLPKWFRAFLFWWLDKFHVYHKPEILEHLQQLEKDGKGSLSVEHLYKGYSWMAVFKKV